MEGAMTEEGLLAGAERIVAARGAVAKLDGLPDAERPRTIEDGYRMLRIATQRWADEPVGWKVGATSREVQAMFGIGEPVYGPIFKTTVHASPARLQANAFQHLLLEAEFTFSFRADLPLRTEPYARDGVLEAIDAVIPSIEVISPRFKRLSVDHTPQFIADFSGNAAAVMGTPCTDWRRLDFAAQGAAMIIGGVKRQEGTGAVTLGNPLNVLEWLVAAMATRGHAIRKGDLVMTGTMTGLHAPKPGEPAVADFGPLGKVEVVFE
jgi:2-keto-4-pentenoate hydratase